MSILSKTTLKSDKEFLHFLEKNFPLKDPDLILRGRKIRKDRSFTLHVHRRLRFYMMMVEKYCPNFRKVLDVGSYPGSIARSIKLIYPNTSVVASGVDFNDEFCEMMRTEQIEVTEWDMDLPLPSAIPYGKYPFVLKEQFKESFCLVTAGEVIHHVLNVLHMLKEINKVLKPGGYFMCDDPCGSYVLNGIRLLVGRPLEDIEMSAMYRKIKHEWGGHMRFFTAKDFLKMLSDTGFKVEKIIYHGPVIPKGVNSFPVKICHIIKSFSYIIPHLRPTIFVVAKKISQPGKVYIKTANSENTSVNMSQW